MVEVKPILEICSVSWKDCQDAQKHGANRIELCASMAAGGLTPSFATFQLAKEHCTIPIAVMIRSRGAGFCYSDEDIEVMRKDAELFLQNGASAIVFGFLTKDRHVDEKLTKTFIDLAHAYQAEAVFHRAIDQCTNIVSEVQVLKKIGIDRVLTAGGSGNAEQYIDILKQLQNDYGQDMQIQMCGNIRSDNVKTLMNDTSIWNVHSACRIFLQDESDPVEDTLTYANAYDAVSQIEVERMAQQMK